MKYRRILRLSALIAPFLLVGCVGSSNSIDLNPELVKKCDRPISDIPDRISPSEVEKYWAIDRKRLADCADRHGSVVDSEDNFQKGLRR